MNIKTSLFVFLLFLVSGNINAKSISFSVTNKTEQMITKLEYWIGSSNESNSAGLNYSSKGSLAKDGKIDIPLDFHKKKRNTVLFRAYLKGGGYVSQRYTISKGEMNPKLDLFNIAEKIPTDEYKKVITKFTELKLDQGYVKVSEENGLNSLIGSIVIYDKNGKVISKIDPKVLNTRLSSTSLPDLKQKISGTFSSETSASGDVSLPFVSVSSAFESGDVAKFVWEIEDVGQFNWSSEQGKDLAELFFSLPDSRKLALVQLYKDNPDAKMEFIDQAFVIGRLEVITHKSKRISTDLELNGANYVTAKGNYLFIDDLKDEFVLKNVITEVKGYNATNLLKTLYAQELAKTTASNTSSENEKLKEEYKFLLGLYPEILVETDNISVMKKALKDLSENKDNQLLYIKETLNSEIINLDENKIKMLEK